MPYNLTERNKIIGGLVMKQRFISKETIQKIIDGTDIKEIIEEDIGSLEFESGTEYHGYHSNKHGSDSETSFKVNQEKGVYHCFNCGEGGDAINWLMNNRGMTFLKAVHYLAARRCETKIG